MLNRLSLTFSPRPEHPTTEAGQNHVDRAEWHWTKVSELSLPQLQASSALTVAAQRRQRVVASIHPDALVQVLILVVRQLSLKSKPNSKHARTQRRAHVILVTHFLSV